MKFLATALLIVSTGMVSAQNTESLSGWGTSSAIKTEGFSPAVEKSETRPSAGLRGESSPVLNSVSGVGGAYNHKAVSALNKISELAKSVPDLDKGKKPFCKNLYSIASDKDQAEIVWTEALPASIAHMGVETDTYQLNEWSQDKESLVLGYSRVAKAVISNFNDAECDGSFDPTCVADKEKSFKEYCGQIYDNFLKAVDVGLNPNYQAQLRTKLDQIKYSGSGGQYVGQSPTCGNTKNCYFLSGNGAKSCQPLNCAMGDISENKALQEASEPLNAFLFAASNYTFSSDDESLCSKCFLEQFKLTSGRSKEKDFVKAKQKSKENLEDILAGNRGAKALLKLVEKSETNFDLAVLYPVSHGGSPGGLCSERIAGTFDKFEKKGCGNSLPTERIKRRIEVALSALSAERSSRDRKKLLEESISKLVNPDLKNSCSRGDFVKFAQQQIDLPQNAPHLDGLYDLLNWGEGSEPALGVLKESCSGEKERRSFKGTFSKKAMKEVWKKVGPEVTKALKNGEEPEEVWDKICLSGNIDIHKFACGENNSIFQQMAETAKKEFVAGFDGNIEKAENFIKESLRARFQTAIQVPMSLSPWLKASLGSWDVICENYKDYLSDNEKRRGGFGNYIGHLPEDPEALKNKLATFKKGACDDVEKRIERAICSSGPVLGENKERSSYTPEDIEHGLSQLAGLDDGIKAGLARNSLKCEFKGVAKTDPSLFSNWSKTLPKTYDWATASSYEQRLTLNKDSEEARHLRATALSFNNFNQPCNQQTRAALEWYLAGSGSGYQGHVPEYDLEKFTSAAKVLNERTKLLEKEAIDRVIDSELDNLFNKPSFAGQGGENSAFGSSGELGSNQVKRVGRVPASIEPSGEPLSDAPVDETGDQAQNRFEKMFSFMDKPNAAEASVTAASNFATSFIPSVSNEAKECDEDCVREVASAKKGEDTEKLAEKAGIVNYGASSKDMKRMFEDVLDGKLKNKDLETLKKENEKLRKEMAEIRKSLQEKSKPMEVLDSEGRDRQEMVPQPASNPAVVFNPRVEKKNEFRSRSYFDDKKEQLAPDFTDRKVAERLSLAEYTADRRAAAAGAPVEKVKNYNANIDRSFLRSRSGDAVDDAFILDYVKYVDKSEGSIEHLIVFENGVPSKIRVPDPKNPGKYVEHPIAEEMVAEILEQVEKDEVDSYALFNMVNFGQSLQDFIQALDTEKNNLTTLSSLNNKLEQLRDLQD